METEEQISALLVPFGETLSQEQVPSSSVVLVVEGGLRVSGLDVSANEFTLRRLDLGNGLARGSALTNYSSATCRTTGYKTLLVPVQVWRQWWSLDSSLGKWLALNPEREDIYAALRCVLVQRELQDISLAELLDEVESLCVSKQALQDEDIDFLFSNHPQLSWYPTLSKSFIPRSSAPDHRGCSEESLKIALHQSPCGLRIVGIDRISKSILTPSVPQSTDPCLRRIRKWLLAKAGWVRTFIFSASK